MIERDRYWTTVVIFLVWNVETGVKGCPTGWTPSYDPVSRTTISCVLETDCEPGSQCRWSPYSTELMCCRYFPGNSQGSPTPPWYIAPSSKQLQQPTFPTPPPIAAYQEPEGSGMPRTAPPEYPENGAPPPEIPTPQRQTAIAAPVYPDGQITNFPVVSPLIVGKWLLTGDPNVVQRTGSVTLITDKGYNIVVDTGVTCRAQDIVNALAARGLHPSMVQMVVITHGHPDHFGNVALFPNSQFVYWENFYKNEDFLTFGLNQADNVRLTDNTELWKTPGHTPESISLVVRNVPNMSTVAVTGDLFISETDILMPSLWQALAWNATAQEENRNMILCMVSWIVPGHSRMFAVTEDMKSSAGCSESSGDTQAPMEAPATQEAPQEVRNPASEAPAKTSPPSAPVYAKIVGTPLPTPIYAKYITPVITSTERDTPPETTTKKPETMQPLIYGGYLNPQAAPAINQPYVPGNPQKPPVYGPQAYYLSQVGQPMTLVRYNGRYYSYAVPPRYGQQIAARRQQQSVQNVL